jgi:2-hydroxy-6-oxonona-2,4-dienedioate hydrolase
MTDNGTQTILEYPFGAAGIVSRALECGRGDDIIVCLHGAGSRADRWRRNLPGLAQAGYHVYAIDFPGHGFASKPADFEYGTARYADVLEEFLDQLVSGPVTLAGTSLGAHVAAVVALRRHETVKAAALIGAVGLVRTDRDLAQTAGKVSDTTPTGVRDKLEFLVFDSGLVTDSWVAEEYRINSSPGAAEALAQVRTYLEGQIDNDLVGEQYADLGIPTILIWGLEDRWVAPDVGRRTADLIPAAPLVLLERAGHAPYFERPDAFNKVLTDYLGDPGGYETGIRVV